MVDIDKYDLRIVPSNDIALLESYDIRELKSKINSYRFTIAALTFIIVGGLIYIVLDQQDRKHKH